MGLRVFLDSEELQLGDDLPIAIQDAMRSASLHIAIFSKRYAESPWCLAELSYMLKSGGKIILVFYDVEPSDLRYIKKGAYPHAFARHEEKGRYGSEKLEEWKEALYKVSFRTGWVLSKLNDDQGKLLKSIVNSASKIVKQVPLEVAKHPVGLDQATLQSKLLNDVLNIDCKIDSLSEGTKILRYRLGASGILVILDDINHVDQLDALLVKDALRRGSLIIVTSRDKDVLRRSGISLFYEAKGLNEKHSQELFCWHAFLQPHPAEGFEDLVAEFLNVCRGLPLSLMVFGGHLYGNMDNLYWESQLEKVRKILPDDIKGILKVSYDALDREEKQIFLDIACFFGGKDKDMAVRIWDGSGWSGYCGLQTLQFKCLVDVDNDNCLQIHDHLRDLGRDLADEQSLHSNLPCRLWRLDDVTKILQRRMGRMEVRGIMAANGETRSGLLHCTSYYQPPFEDIQQLAGTCSHLTSFGLELLVIKDNCFSPNFNHLSRDLVWLRWYDCPHTSIPSWLSSKNLRVLEIFGGDLEELWESNAQNPLQLKELNICTRYTGKLPKSIASLRHLEKIVLVETRNRDQQATPEDLPANFSLQQLKSLPEEFCFIQSLKHLELRDCESLVSLPVHFGNLKNLQHISLSGCKSLQTLPYPFGRLTKLQYLDLDNCVSLNFRAEMLGNTKTLEHLDFSNCTRLQVLPSQITSQRSLKWLYLVGTSLQELPDDFGQLSNLSVLTIGSPFLTSLPPSIGNLTRLTVLNVDRCLKLQCIPETVGQLNLLKNLTIRRSMVEFLPKGVGQLVNLQYLNVWLSPLRVTFTNANAIGCARVEEKPYFKKHSGLWSNLDVSICGCMLRSIVLCSTNVSKISIHQEDCPNLEKLQLDCNAYLIEVEIFSTSLVELDLTGCIRLRRISGVADMAELRELSLSDCNELAELPSLEHLKFLDSFDASGCWKLQNICGLEQLERLTVLTISSVKRNIWNCIRPLQRVPPEMTLSGKAVKSVDSILNSSTFLELPLVDHLTPIQCSDKDSLKLEIPLTQVNWWSAMIMICHVIIGSSEPTISVEFCNPPEREQKSYFFVNEGQWVCITIFTQYSWFIKDLQNSLIEAVIESDDSEYEIKGAWMVMISEGEEWKILQVLEKWLTIVQ
eukprot:Gb_01678 [translate_table: standard]